MGVKPNNSTLTVTTAGTRVRTTATATWVVAIYFEAKDTNTGTIYIGDSAVSSSTYVAALTPGSGYGITVDTYGRFGSSQGGPELQLNAWYADSSVSGEKVQVTYIERVGSL